MVNEPTNPDRTNPVPTVVKGALAEALAAQDDKLMNCVHCGFCLPACPTYVRLGDENDSPRGRLYLMRAVVEGRLAPDSHAFQEHIDRCLGCRACETVCPSGVEYGALLERAREVSTHARPADWRTRTLLRLFGSGGVESLFLLFSRVARWSRFPAWLSRVLPERGALRSARFGMAMLAASAPADLRRRPSEATNGRPASSTPSGSRGRVGVLRGCVQDGLFRRVNDATERVLRANGFEVVHVGGQGCCGALHAHGGALDRARELARSNVRAFGDSELDFIVVNAAGCGAVMKEYGELFDDGGADLRDEERRAGHGFAERVRDVSELLAEVGPRPGASLSATVTYDAPCHLLHAQGVSDAPLRILDAVPGLRRVPLARSDECCGGAGIYGVTHPELGGQIGSDKTDAVIASGADFVATGNPGCMMQIGAGLHLRGSSVRAVHPIELLDESYRRAGYYSDSDSTPHST